MSSYKIIILEQAVSEIEESCLYYNNQSPGLGFKFEEDVFQLLEIIKNNPLLFPIKFEYMHEALLGRFPYIIVYEVVGKKIIIIAVFHTKRHPDKKIKRSR